MFRIPLAAILASTAALATLGCGKDPPPAPRPKLTDADRETVAAEMKALRARADEADKQRRAAVDKAVPPSDDPSAPKCPVTVKQLLGEFEETDLVTHRTGLNTRAYKIADLYPAPEWWHDEGRARGSVDSDLGMVEIWLKPDSDGYTAGDLLARVRGVELPEYILTIVPKESVKPIRLGNDEFRGGFIKGHAYLWSEGEKRLVCGATIAAQSSSDVKVFSGGETGLLIDLVASAAIMAAYRFTVLPEAPPGASATAAPSRSPGKAAPKAPAP